MSKYYLKHISRQFHDFGVVREYIIPLPYAKSPGIAARDALEEANGLELTKDDELILVDEKLRPLRNLQVGMKVV